MRQLIAADGHNVAFTEEDIARLMNGVGKQKSGKCMTGGFLLGFDGGITKQLRLGDQRQKRQHKLVERRYG